MAHGDVTAGIDLSQVTEQDVEVVSGTITLRLPAPEVLNASLNNQKSYVYDRQTGIFTKADPQLESEVRQQAEQAILQAALEDGILTQAQQNAEQTLRTLLHGLHYDTVTFVTAPVPTPPSGSPTPGAAPTPSTVPTPGG